MDYTETGQRTIIQQDTKFEPTVKWPEHQQHMNYVMETAQKDVNMLFVKEAEYNSSWKKRGGVGVFMMLARKWDRLEEQVSKQIPGTTEDPKVEKFDIIIHCLEDGRDEGILDDIGDLRRYLMLVEAEVRSRRGNADR